MLLHCHCPLVALILFLSPPQVFVRFTFCLCPHFYLLPFNSTVPHQIRLTWRPSSNLIQIMVCILCVLVASHHHSFVGLRESEARSTVMQGGSESYRTFHITHEIISIDIINYPNPSGARLLSVCLQLRYSFEQEHEKAQHLGRVFGLTCLEPW